jgi:hypothetical protein
MTTGGTVNGPGFPRMALGLAWFGCALTTGTLGLFTGFVFGRVLVAAAVLGLVALGAVVSNRGRRVTLAFSTVAGAVVIAAGVLAAAGFAAGGILDAGQAALLAAVPVAGGLLTELLSRRASRMAQAGS